MANNSNSDNLLPSPSGLTASALPERKIHISFSGNNENGFEIWRRHGDTVDWYLHATTSEPDFEDADVKPGQYYEYKVRAVSGDAASEFSESAVVYGVE